MKAEAELYAHGTSAFHRWDPRWKVASLAVLSFVLAGLESVSVALGGMGVSLVALLSARLPWRLVGARLGMAQIFLLPCVILLPFSFGGETVTVGPFNVSSEGLRWAVLFYCRAVGIIALGIAVIYSTPMVILLRALQGMRMPRVLVEVALLTYRYLFTLAAEAARTRWALTTRGFGARSFRHSYRPLANSVGLALVRSMERTERIQQAMYCRGFRGRLHTLQRFHAGLPDWIQAAVWVGLAVGLALLDRA